MTAGLFDRFQLGPVALRNRLVKAATYEGLTPDGLVSDELVELHRRTAAGGVAVSTVAYCAVSSEGRTYRHQLWARPESAAGLARLAEAVTAEGAVAGIQLGHAGWFSNPKATGEPSIGPSRTFSPYGLCWPRPMTPADFDRVAEAFCESAVLAADAGFGMIEVHLGHGYLLSQMLSPYTNRRRDDHGGELANRARFPRRVVSEVLAAVGGRVAVTAKLNMSDGFDGGLTLDEGATVARWLVDDGIHAIQLTGGFTARTPMFLMRGDVPLSDLIALERHPARRWGMRLVGRRVLRHWSFEEAFFRDDALVVRAATDGTLMQLGGINHRSSADRALAEGFELVAMARALLRDPDLPRRWESGDDDGSGCIHCNQCVVQMEVDGTRCVLPGGLRAPQP